MKPSRRTTSLCRQALAVALCSVAWPAHALSPSFELIYFDVPFDVTAAALPARERQQIATFVEDARRNDFCPLHAAVVHGTASTAKGAQVARKPLSDQRVLYVASLLRLYGLPSTHVSTESHVTLAPRQDQSPVYIEIIGVHGYPSCGVPRDSSGFRVHHSDA